MSASKASSSAFSSFLFALNFNSSIYAYVGFSFSILMRSASAFFFSSSYFFFRASYYFLIASYFFYSASNLAFLACSSGSMVSDSSSRSIKSLASPKPIDDASASTFFGGGLVSACFLAVEEV
jgi:hypothetical protein